MSISTPHDAIFKRFLTDLVVARDFLEIHLPEKIRVLCDFGSLAIEPNSFVEEELRQHHADILYSLNIDNEKGYIFVLLEHQSTADPLMPFRMLRYGISAMKQHLKSGSDKLPIITPLLFYHGEDLHIPTLLI